MLDRVVKSVGWVGTAGLLAGSVLYLMGRWDWFTQANLYGGLVLVTLYGILNFGALQGYLTSPAGRHGSAAGISVLAVLGMVVLVNFLSFRHHRRIDMTENLLYSLSDQSLKVMGNLQMDIRVLGFFADERQQMGFKQLLEQYAYVSPRLEYQVVDPQLEPGLTAKYGLKRAGQLVIEGGDKQEILDDLSEEKVTNAILKVTRETEKVIYFMEGHGERGLEDTSAQGFSVVGEEIRKQNYRVETWNLAQQNQLPEAAAVLVSAGPKVEFLEPEVTLLEEFLQKGGKFLLLVDPDSEFVMADFLARYGLALGGKVAIDVSGLGRLFGLSGAAPIVGEYANHPITRDLGGVMTFFPMAQNVLSQESELEYQSQGLLFTSPRSWAESDIQQEPVAFDESVDIQGPLELAAVATKKVEAEAEPSPEETEGEREVSQQKQPPLESRLVLFGDADFASNAYFEHQANGDLFLITLAWLAEEADLLSIRPKEPQNRTISLSFGQSRLILLVTVFLLPLGSLILGVAIWNRRR